MFRYGRSVQETDKTSKTECNECGAMISLCLAELETDDIVDVVSVGAVVIVGPFAHQHLTIFLPRDVYDIDFSHRTYAQKTSSLIVCHLMVGQNCLAFIRMRSPDITFVPTRKSTKRPNKRARSHRKGGS